MFVEVRYRASADRGPGAESVTAAKVAKLTRTANHFLQAHPEYRNAPCRIDVLSMGNEVDWFRSAITLDG